MVKKNSRRPTGRSGIVAQLKGGRHYSSAIRWQESDQPMTGRLKQHNSCDGGRSMENKANRAALTLASAFLGAAMFWAPTVAMAQSTTDADTAAAASAGDIEELVVTARRRSERLIDVPVAVTAVTVEQIRQYDLTEAENIKIVPQ